MLRSCPYCGRIHDDRYTCPDKTARLQAQQNRRRIKTNANSFRKSTTWTKRSLQIRERDHYMCLCCAEGLMQAGADSKAIELMTTNLEVHHIVPIEEDYSLRLDETNLITVCGYHHELCERQEINRDMQKYLVRKSIDRREKTAVPIA